MLIINVECPHVARGLISDAFIINSHNISVMPFTGLGMNIFTPIINVHVAQYYWMNKNWIRSEVMYSIGYVMSRL